MWHIKARIKKRQPLPDWYLDEPPLLRDQAHQFLFDCYADLQTERRFSGGPIPRSAVVLYAREQGLDNDASRFVWQVMRQMDDADLEWAASNIKREAEQGDGDHDGLPD